MKKARYEQQDIHSWFDESYRKRGFNYLRPREAYYIFTELLGAPPNKKILDIACGPGLLLSVADEKGLKTYGVDISPEAVGMCNNFVPNAEACVANAESLPYHDRQFDFITCLGSLERFMNLEKALSEQIRVAKDEALFCYMVRNANTFTWRFFMQFLGMQDRRSHQGAKTLQEWKKILDRSGLEILTIHHDHWPYLRFLKWITLGGKFVDYCKTRKNLLPIEYACEFIIIAKKRFL